MDEIGLTYKKRRSAPANRIGRTSPKRGGRGVGAKTNLTRLDGSTACMALEGATDTEAFRAYVRDILGPTLRPGDIVVMDNLSPHKSEATLQLIVARGAAVRFLPAYSPDLNPIEKMWSKLKALLRKAEARTPEKLHEAIGAGLARITPNDARGWFTSCGYSFI